MIARYLLGQQNRSASTAIVALFIGALGAVAAIAAVALAGSKTGLVLALWLKRLGAEVRVIDVTSEPGTTSRALAVHAFTHQLIC